MAWFLAETDSACYKARMIGRTDTAMILTNWRVWVLPKCKLFA